MKEKRLTALITGANKGIGFSVAEELLRLGYYVYLGARDKVKGQAAINTLKAKGFSKVSLLSIDVADPVSVWKAAAWLAGKEDHLDVLVNNAAIGGRRPQKASSGDVAILKEVFDTNFFGAIEVTRAFLLLMRRSEAPRIVNVSSELSSLWFQERDTSSFYATELMAYSASKTALNSFTLMLAKELQHTEFKVNSVTPGFTATDLTDHSGHQTPEEAARIVVKFATLSQEGPSGQFFGSKGRIPW
ncbi:SDR family oxidoreductase [Puia dinghuensis]|uniref:Dehydrogenase n=1 Tax=Puia dinghuensis TaxID=1792502 RepID=A0A8J2UDS8_9BACT|nr:SDR family oxidoreductase [Puia dinghuensis]GGB02507.1 dehydrogenase [Puia dinghuensis]